MAKRQPRGIRNFNPGNIDYNERQFIRDRWVGEVGLENHPHARFTVFRTHEHGIRAMVKILLTYADKRKAADGSDIDTVQEIIDRWAPPHENDTASYVKHIRGVLCVKEGEKIDVHERDVMLPLVKAIIEHENGQQPYSDETILGGMDLAGMRPRELEIVTSKLPKKNPLRRNDMNDSKPFWASKTLWVNLIAVVAAISGTFGIDLGLDPETQVAFVGAIMGVVNIVLRFVTKTPIG